MSTNRCSFGAAIVASLLISPCAICKDQDVALSDLPVAVVQAAEAAVAGLKVSSAEVETEDGETIYELEGTANGTEYEVEVTADGRVLEIESNE